MSFLESIAIILISSILIGGLFKKIFLPPLIGMLIIGIILGPCFLNMISPNILNISTELRQFALTIILLRAGLSLNLNDLKKVGRPAFLLCFIPASIEILGYLLIAPLLLNFSLTESALLGAVMGAVSPAVVVPRMIKIKNEEYGTNKCIPQMITFGASCDDIFVIVLFSSFLSMVSQGTFDFNIFWKIPVSIITGILIGIIIGIFINFLFKKINIRNTIKILIILSISFLLLSLETKIKNYIPFSAYLSIITIGIFINLKDNQLSEKLSIKFEKIWIFAEIILFVLVGALVDITYVFSSFKVIILSICFALCFRIIGVFICLIKTNLNIKEKLFCALSYLPKATVQAAIGSIPLSLGLSCGEEILASAVLAILITAPLGAFLTDITYKKLLSHT